jgi:hypothetical protein
MVSDQIYFPISTKSKMNTQRCMIELMMNDNSKVVEQIDFIWLVAR